MLLSQAIHALDLMLHLLGPVTDVTALTATTPVHRMETEDFRRRPGCGSLPARSVAFVATTAAFPGGSEVLWVDGDEGAAELGNGELVVRWRDGRVERESDSWPAAPAPTRWRSTTACTAA